MKFPQFIGSIGRKARAYLLGEISDTLRRHRELVLQQYTRQTLADAKNPLNKSGAKYFSQNEEDGITLEILRRIGIEEGSFAEFGVGVGSENNTLILLAKGWNGFWIGGEKLFFDAAKSGTRFRFFQRWIDRDNIYPLFCRGLKSIDAEAVDVLSVDLDGNDIYVIEELLAKQVRPGLCIVEYNAKFPPPINWKIDYDPLHRWMGDDYFGASLSAFVEMFGRFGYTLVCCNLSGTNAFFVKNELANRFLDIPQNINDLFYGPGYYLFSSFGLPPSAKTIERMLN